MPLTHEEIIYELDPIILSDVPENNKIRLCICGSGIDEGHETTELQHEHKVVGDYQLCRMLMECGGRKFYQYAYNDSTNFHYINSEISLNIITPDCPKCGKPFVKEVFTLSAWTFMPDHKLIRTYAEYGKPPTCLVSCYAESRVRKFYTRACENEIKIVSSDEFVEVERVPTNWEFATQFSTSEDWTPYMEKALVVGQELELDWKGGHGASDAAIARAFNVKTITGHDGLAGCFCGEPHCWKHLPDNLIRTIQNDGSINGKEFLIYGTDLSSEEYASRIPINAFAKYFEPTQADGLHVHVMITHEHRVIPDVILRNAWQLFRYYYPAWAYMFGNTKDSFLRRSPNGNHYATFDSYSESPFSGLWYKNVSGIRFGFNIQQCQVIKDANGGIGISNFDVEIRTSDSTIDLEQLTMSRALARALVMKATQLSNYGLINIESSGHWDESKEIISALNSYMPLTAKQMNFMRNLCDGFIRELSAFLTDFERGCAKNLIVKPVRDRTIYKSADDMITKLSDNAKTVKKYATLCNITANSESEWIERVAELTHKTTRDIREGIKESKAWYDEPQHIMLVV